MKKFFRNNDLANERGGALIEAMITVVLIAIALPPLIQLFGSIMIDTAITEVESKAIRLGRQKMEDIVMDKSSLSRGFSWVTTSGRYASESLTGSYTRTVQVDTVGKVFSGVSYAEVTVSVAHSLIPTVQLKSWFARF